MSKFITIKNASFTIPAEEESPLQKLILEKGQIHSWGNTAPPRKSPTTIPKKKEPTLVKDYVLQLINSGDGMSKDDICVDTFRNSGITGIKLRSADLPLHHLVREKKITKDEDGKYRTSGSLKT